MPDVICSRGTLGARISGIDLSRPLSRDGFALILRVLGERGVVCFPNQHLDPAGQAEFSGRFGELEVHVSGAFQVPDQPEVMVLSNIVDNGRPIGLADAGQDWHTDMSFSGTIAFVNVLYALKVPRRNGRVLGDTQFADMAAAYEDLPAELKTRLEGMTATHDFAKFWDMMRARGGNGNAREPLTEAQRRRKPPVSQAIILTHPLSGRKILYANPGYAVCIDGLPQTESDALLDALFVHQLQPKYRFAHQWSEHDVLMWDNIRTMHNAVADYGPDEHRLVRRCQAMANLVFQPGWATHAMHAAA
jgi:taurine dioxygenase